MISVGVRSQAKHRPSVCSQSDMGQSYLLESLVSEDNSILLGRLASEGKFILLESLGASAAFLDSTVASPRWPLSTAVLPPPCPGLLSRDRGSAAHLSPLLSFSCLPGS